MLAPFLFAAHEVFSTEKRQARFLLVAETAACATRPEPPGSMPCGFGLVGGQGTMTRGSHATKPGAVPDARRGVAWRLYPTISSGATKLAVG